MFYSKTMGFGLPCAIGCKTGAPDKIVIDIDGDASLSMTAMELATASQYNIGVKCMVLNNGVQGMVYQWQGESHPFRSLAQLFDLVSFMFSDLFYDSRYSHTQMFNPDFVMLAKSMHVHAIRVENAAELPQKMKEFLEYDNSKPILMECIVEPNEHVFPMVRRVLFLSDLGSSLNHRFYYHRSPLEKRCISRSCIQVSVRPPNQMHDLLPVLRCIRIGHGHAEYSFTALYASCFMSFTSNLKGGRNRCPFWPFLAYRKWIS